MNAFGNWPPPYNAMRHYAGLSTPLPARVWVNGGYGGPWLFDVVPFADLKKMGGAAVYMVGRREYDGGGLGLLGPVVGITAPGCFIRPGYVGECESLCDRHGQHHREVDFQMFHADVALVHYVADERLRCIIELDIRHRYNPPLNRE